MAAADLPPPPARILLYAKEFAFNASRRAGPSGTWQLQIRNSGEDEHDLRIRSLGGVTVATSQPVLPSSTATVRVRLRPGTYTLYCGVAGHEQLGMSVPLIIRKPKVRTTLP